MKQIRLILLMLSTLGVVNPGASSGHGSDVAPPNVLFIAVDDLRPELGCYGALHVHSPHIDRLAGEGVLFTNHFVAVPTCGASRHSLLTGLLPTARGHLRNDVTENTLSPKKESERPETFIHHLKRNGYYTVGIGKISHHPDGMLLPKPSTNPDQLVLSDLNTTEQAPLELPHSWDEMLFDPGKWKSGWRTPA